MLFCFLDYRLFWGDPYWDTLESLVTKEAFGDVDLMDPIYL